MHISKGETSIAFSSSLCRPLLLGRDRTVDPDTEHRTSDNMLVIEREHFSVGDEVYCCREITRTTNGIADRSNMFCFPFFCNLILCKATHVTVISGKTMRSVRCKREEFC